MESKFCSKCYADLPVSEYHKRSASPDGLQDKCKDCSRTAAIEARRHRLERDPEHDKKVKQTWYNKNRERSVARAKQYRIDHPEWAKEMNAKHWPTWRKRYPEKAKVLAQKQAFSRKLRKYGLTPETFQVMIQDQDGKCAICGVVPPDGLVIDHNHVTNKVRELLCTQHNVAVGMIQENPDTARKIISYLEKHN